MLFIFIYFETESHYVAETQKLGTQELGTHVLGTPYVYHASLGFKESHLPLSPSMSTGIKGVS